MVVGAIVDYTGAWGHGSEIISEIHPHTFFLIFLPPLIFESAFSADWHIVRVELVQILILAGPCLLV
jgi:NhaP-type Na+/H+ or K+/H+ antiporter